MSTALASQIETEILSVTPEQAETWLKKNYGNRNLRPIVVQKYVADMMHGSWKFTGEPVKFGADGTLLDGQHRLAAVVQSGKAVDMLVVRNIGDDAREAMDSGARRTAADALQFSGHKYPNQKAALANLALHINPQGPTLVTNKNHIRTHSEIVEWIEATEDIEPAIVFAMRHHRELNMPTTAASYLSLRFHQVAGEIGQDFLLSIAEHRTEGTGDPRLALIHALAGPALAQRRGALRNLTIIALAATAWNSFVMGKEVKILKVPLATKIPVLLSAT